VNERILIADDHPAVCRALEAVLEQAAFQVLPSLRRWNEVPGSVDALVPDLLLIDFDLPPNTGDGLLASEKVLNMHPDLPVVCISAHVTTTICERAAAVGCRGFISKLAEIEEIPLVVQRVLTNASDGHERGVENMEFDSRTASMLTKFYHSSHTVARERSLTPRELEVLRLVCDGRTNPDIASEMLLSRGTVAQLLSGVFRKLNVSDRAQAAARAVRLQLVP
jgi:DNA-binding NarL/FixJ family response regulator